MNQISGEDILNTCNLLLINKLEDTGNVRFCAWSRNDYPNA